MFSVNVALLAGYKIKIASGNPVMLPYNEQKPGKPLVVTFESDNYFVLHLMRGDSLNAEITPGGGK